VWPLLDIKIDRIIRSRRRTISLEVTPDAALVIRAPIFATKSYIEKVVGNKAAWIISKQQNAMSRCRKYPFKSYTDGEMFWFLGKGCKLEFTQEVEEPEVKDDRLCLPEKLRGNTQAVVTGWYRAQALRVVTLRVKLYSRVTGLEYKSVKISGAKKRWGSCGSNNTLNFSWRIVMVPLRVIDYVVIHELAHTQHHDHSKAFWAKVLEIMPDYQTQKQWLAENSGLLR